MLVAPTLSGDLAILTRTEPVLVQSGAYVSAEMSLDIGSQWGGSRSFCGTGGGLFMLRT